MSKVKTLNAQIIRKGAEAFYKIKIRIFNLRCVQSFKLIKSTIIYKLKLAEQDRCTNM